MLVSAGIFKPAPRIGQLEEMEGFGPPSTMQLGIDNGKVAPDDLLIGVKFFFVIRYPGQTMWLAIICSPRIR
jgi:hypothetical protein